MTIQTVKLGRERFVILREKDYKSLERKANGSKPSRTNARRLTAQDRGDIADARRRANEPTRPYAELRRE